MKNAFILDPSTPIDSIADVLYEKTAQAKAITECVMLAIMNKELENNSLFNVIWAIDSYLEQIKELQQFLEASS